MALGFGMVGFWVISLSKLEGKALAQTVKKKTNGGSRVHVPHCTAGEPGRDFRKLVVFAGKLKPLAFTFILRSPEAPCSSEMNFGKRAAHHNSKG